MSVAVRIRTNAKINLFLRVMGRRADGYHEVETILHGINLADDLSFLPTDTRRVEVNVTLEEGMAGDIPAQEANLAFIAASKLIELGAVNSGMRIDITKRVPMGAGLGGGSGNAAGALTLLNEIWNSHFEDWQLAQLAAEIGSDVPFCLGGGTVLAKGRGEQLTRIPGPEQMWFVLGISYRPMRTRDVYQAWSEWGAASESASAPMTLALGAGDIPEIASLLQNDLEAAAFRLRPELAAKKRKLIEAGSLGASLSGSGPTVFGIAPDEGHALQIAAALEDEFDSVRIVRSQSECIERL